MKKIFMQYLKGSAKYLAVILATAVFMTHITPGIADNKPAKAPQEKIIGTAGLDRTILMAPSTIQGPILDIKVTNTGDETVCDVLVGLPIPPGTHSDDVEYASLTTTDHMMHSQFLMAWFQGKRVVVTGYEIPVPEGRDWGSYETTSYDVRELQLASY